MTPYKQSVPPKLVLVDSRRHSLAAYSTQYSVREGMNKLKQEARLLKTVKNWNLYCCVYMLWFTSKFVFGLKFF